MMWELVFADGTVHEFEDNLIWRVAELLGVSSQTRIRLKQAVRDKIASKPKARSAILSRGIAVRQ